MKTCTGKDIKTQVHVKRRKEFQGPEWDSVFRVFDEQATAQGNIRRPVPLAINPDYCRAYCSGFNFAKKIFNKKKIRRDK